MKHPGLVAGCANCPPMHPGLVVDLVNNLPRGILLICQLLADASTVTGIDFGEYYDSIILYWWVKTMGIREKAIELAAELKKTPDFAELRQAKSAINRVPALKQELEAFNKKQNSLYSSQLPSSEAASRMDQLGKKYAELSKVPEIERYLRASRSFNIILANALKEVNSSIEADLK